MRLSSSRAPLAVAVCAATWLATTIGGVAQQAPAGQAPGGGRAGGGGRGGVGQGVFTAADGNKDGAVTREELKAAFEKWFTDSDTAQAGAVTQDQLMTGLAAAMPAPPAGAPQLDACGGRSANPRVACPADVQAMMAALPATAPAKPARPRKVLVVAATSGFVHSSIPLAAKMMEEMGAKTGAWTATVSYDRADVNAENLKQYDAIFLDSTTGTFLDEPNADTDPAAKATTEARRKALLDFIRNGKGIGGIHAATDSYHGNPAGAGRAGGGGFGGGRGRGNAGTIAPLMLTQGDTNGDQKLSRAEASALADVWFDKMDAEKAGSVKQADFGQRFAAVMPAPAAQAPAAAAAGIPGGSPLWPEWNKIIGGYFKFHWNYPTKIVVKIDDPKSPLTAPFKGEPFEVTDEVYTYNQDSFSRTNVHVLTSIDYSKMPDAVKAQESTPRTDHDYALSWVRREGKGRLFYEAIGHHETNYANKALMEHVLAGMQYAIGDLKADDAPSVKGGTK